MTNDEFWTSQNTVSLKSAAGIIGIKTETLQRIVNHSIIESRRQRILKSDMMRLKSEHESYLGVRSFMAKHSNERFAPRFIKHRNRFIRFLDENDYFGFQLFYPEELLTGEAKREDFYFHKDVETKLDELCAPFFRDYGVTEKEKAEKLLSADDREHPVTRKYLKGFWRANGKDRMDGAVSEFVQLVLSSTDVSNWTPEIVNILVNKAGLQGTKKLVPEFYNFVAQKEGYQRSSLVLIQSNREEITDVAAAYSFEKIRALARILFDADYEREHQLIERALEHSLFIEMWLYLAIHYICGARNEDICEIWRYLDLEKDNFLNINLDTLKDDILSDSIPNEVYRAAAVYVLTNVAPDRNRTDTGQKPNKTRKGTIYLCADDSLDCFFGKLMVIAEYHKIQHVKRNAQRKNPRDFDDGHMKKRRISQYCAWTQCGLFFGEQFIALFGHVNINSRSLTKSLIQGVEEFCRRHGMNPMKAYLVAVAARGHMSLFSSVSYQKDHNYSGENIKEVTTNVFNRGVLPSSIYSVLVSTHENFRLLPMAEQTRIMSFIKMSPFEIELAGYCYEVESKFLARIMKGNSKGAAKIIDSLISIAYGNGDAKDYGVICLRTALGKPCDHPTCRSCIGNLCPNCILTRYAVDPFTRVFRNYYQKSIDKDNPFRWKYACILSELIKKAGNEMFELTKNKLSEEERTLYETSFRRHLDGDYS